MRLYQKKLLGSVAILASVLSGISPANAIDWSGTASENWHDSANWVGGVVPVSGDVRLNVTGRTFVESAASFSSITFGSSSGVVLDVNGPGSLTGTSLIAGYASGTDGALTVSGNTAALSTQFLYSGFEGNGSIIIKGGATASSNTLHVGSQLGTYGEFTVDGSGTTWTAGIGGTFIGDFGEGNYTVSGGAKATDYAVQVGYNADGKGHVSVDGPDTTWSITGGSTVAGNYGTGAIEVTNGASVTTSTAFLGYYGSGSGSLDLSGADTNWKSTSYIMVGYEGAGGVTVRDDATLTVSSNLGIRIGFVVGSSGTVNIGAAEGEAAEAAGHINSLFTVFDEGTGKLVFNHTNSDYNFSSSIFGAGTINHLAGVTTFSGNSSSLGGTTNIFGGTALVTGSLGGAINVFANGTLGGTGTVGKSGTTVSINNGGTLSPGAGNATGTLLVAGNLAFSSGSTFVVQVDGDSSDAVVLTGGDVTINPGTSLQIAVAGTATAGSYTILKATSISGTFSSIDWGGLSNYQISYDGGLITVSSTGAAIIGGNPSSPNQSSVLSALRSGGAPSGLVSLVAALPTDKQEEALQQLSGEIQTAPRAAFVQTGRSVNNTVNGRIRSVTDGVAAPSVPALGYAEENKSTKHNQFSAFENKANAFDQDRFSVWTNGFGSWGQVDGVFGAPDTDISSAGVIVGGDAVVAEQWRVGMFGGYSRSSFDTSDSDGDSNNYHLGAYAGTRWDAVSFRTGINYTWHKVDTARDVSFLGETLRSDYDANSLNMFGELSYRIDVAPASFEPFVSLSHTRVKTDGFTETGGLGALTVDENKQNTTFTTLGIRASTDLDVGSVPSTLRGSLGWLHAFGDVDPQTTARFSSGDSFVITGTPLDKNMALIQTGVDFTLSPASTLSVSYNGQFSANAYEHGANAKFQVRF
jgi:outer membrane autotransporter protein